MAEKLIFAENQITQPFRLEKSGMKTYLVAPGVLVREQVLNGFYLPLNEIGGRQMIWNGVPITVGHPNENFGSANVPFPDVPIVGRFYGAFMKETELHGEFWFEESLLDEIPDGARIKENLEKNQVMEVSSAYWADVDWIEGSHENVPYLGVQKNLHPDHAAILLDAVGACSVEAGCGIPRNSSNSSDPLEQGAEEILPIQEKPMKKNIIEEFINFLKGLKPPDVEEEPVAETPEVPETPAAVTNETQTIEPPVPEVIVNEEMVAVRSQLDQVSSELQNIKTWMTAQRTLIIENLVQKNQNRVDLEKMPLEQLFQLQLNLSTTQFSLQGQRGSVQTGKVPKSVFLKKE